MTGKHVAEPLPLPSHVEPTGIPEIDSSMASAAAPHLHIAALSRTAQAAIAGIPELKLPKGVKPEDVGNHLNEVIRTTDPNRRLPGESAIDWLARKKSHDAANLSPKQRRTLTAIVNLGLIADREELAAHTAAQEAQKTAGLGSYIKRSGAA